MPSFTCRDAGVDCDFIAEAKKQDKLLKKITKHAKKVHDMDPIPDGMLKKVMGAIKALPVDCRLPERDIRFFTMFRSCFQYGILGDPE